jgi:hypothetical protein
MLNSVTLNGSGRALWVRLATATALAASTAVSATYSYQQRATVGASAGITATLVAKKNSYATAYASATGIGAPYVVRVVNSGPVMATATATGLAIRPTLVQGQASATAGAVSFPVLVGAIGSANAVATATIYSPVAIRGKPAVSAASAEVTATATGVPARYGQLSVSLAGILYTRAETTLALVADNLWNAGGSWDDGWQWNDATIWRHEGFVPGATATGTVSLDDDLIVRWIRDGAFSSGRAESISAHPTQGQFSRGSALSSVTGAVAPTLTFKVAATGVGGVIPQVTAARVVPTAVQATITTQAWISVFQRHVASATALAEAVGTRPAPDYHQAGSSLGNGSCTVQARPADLYYGMTLATGTCTTLPLGVRQGYAASVLESGLAGVDLVRANWSYQYRATAAAIAWVAASATPRSGVYATTQASFLTTGQVLASVFRRTTGTATAAVLGVATPANQYRATTLTQAGAVAQGVAIVARLGQAPAAATATGGATPADQYYADLVATVQVTGRTVATTLADTPAAECRILRAVAEPRVIRVPFDDRLLRVTC